MNYASKTTSEAGCLKIKNKVIAQIPQILNPINKGNTVSVIKLPI